MVLLLYHIEDFILRISGDILAISEHLFGPVFDSNSEILILGSFPSVISREKSFYYQNPQNRFFKILAELYDPAFLSSSIEEIKQLLYKYHIALYDVVLKCEITGSSDQSIRIIEYAPIEELINQSKISHIYCNGKTAYNLFNKRFKAIGVQFSLLPSTSPANAKSSLNDLIFNWQIIKNR